MNLVGSAVFAGLWFYVGWICCAARHELAEFRAETARDEAWDKAHAVAAPSVREGLTNQ